MLIGKLNFVCLPRIIKNAGPHGAVKKPVTDIIVRVGDVEIAKATVGGTYRPVDAAKEFRKAPHRFATVGDTTRERLMALTLAA